MTRLKASVISRFVNFRRTRAHDTSGCLARRENEGVIPAISTRQLLLILHRCRELRIADRNSWPQFLFGKDLEEMSEAEAARLLAHLETQINQEVL